MVWEVWPPSAVTLGSGEGAFSHVTMVDLGLQHHHLAKVYYTSQ